MVNRNAARHLMFAVSILLCFFVYMGYRLRGPKTQPETPATPTTEFASFQGGAAESGVSPAPESQTLRPNDSASSLPSVISGDDDFSDWVPAARGDELALAPSSGTASAMRPPPSLPIPSEPSSPASVITGLIPAPPQEFAPAPTGETAPFLPSLPVPGASGDTPTMSEGFLPPASESLEQHSYELEPVDEAPPTSAFLPPPGMDSQSESYVPPVMATPTPAESAPLRPVSSPVSSPVPVLPPAAAGAPVASASSLAPPYPQAAATRPGTPETESYIRPSSPPPPPPTGSTRPDTGPAARPPAPEWRGDNQSPSESLRIYVVRPGDTLSSIASQELGSITLADNIFLLNRDVIADPDHLMVGIKIRLPIREGGYGIATGNGNNATESGTAVGRRPSYGVGRTHTVARGDTLSSIAQRYYGSSSAWRFLYEANKNVISNPNTLSVGVELSVPPYEN